MDVVVVVISVSNRSFLAIVAPPGDWTCWINERNEINVISGTTTTVPVGRQLVGRSVGRLVFFTGRKNITIYALLVVDVVVFYYSACLCEQADWPRARYYCPLTRAYCACKMSDSRSSSKRFHSAYDWRRPLLLWGKHIVAVLISVDCLCTGQRCVL
jgi:hypothetical protein